MPDVSEVENRKQIQLRKKRGSEENNCLFEVYEKKIDVLYVEDMKLLLIYKKIKL